MDNRISVCLSKLSLHMTTGRDFVLIHFVKWENRLCCTAPVLDSSCGSSVVAGMHEQTDTTDLQHHELASL